MSSRLPETRNAQPLSLRICSGNPAPGMRKMSKLREEVSVDLYNVVTAAFCGCREAALPLPKMNGSFGPIILIR